MKFDRGSEQINNPSNLLGMLSFVTDDDSGDGNGEAGLSSARGYDYY